MDSVDVVNPALGLSPVVTPSGVHPGVRATEGRFSNRFLNRRGPPGLRTG